MTTKKKTDVRFSSFPPPSLYRIEYPNCRTGMFSLRAPFKGDYSYEKQQPIYSRSLTPNVVYPKILHADQITQRERPITYQISKRDAQVQCSLPPPNIRDGIAIRRPPPTFVPASYDSVASSPLYRVALKLQPTKPNVYGAWNVKTPPPRTIPIKQPIQHKEPPPRRIRSPRLVDIKSFSGDDDDDDDDDDDESDYDDHIVYARYPRRIYPPANARMVCVCQSGNTICY